MRRWVKKNSVYREGFDLCHCDVFHFPRMGSGGVTLVDNSMLSAFIVLVLGRYDVSSSPYAPLPKITHTHTHIKPSSIKFACFHSTWKQTKKKNKKHLQDLFSKKKKSLFCFQPKTGTSLWLKRVKKKNNSTVMNGTRQAITDNIPDTSEISHHICTHSWKFTVEAKIQRVPAKMPGL